MLKKTLFNEDYIFKGSQCEKVIKLTSPIDNNSPAIFQTSIDLFIFASLVGVIKNRKSKPEKERGQSTTKIFLNQFSSHSVDLELVYKMILLTCKMEYPEPEARLGKAFRNPDLDENYKLFEEYMLGGLDEIYERVFVDSNRNFEDYLTSINELLNDLTSESNNDVVADLGNEDFF